MRAISDQTYYPGSVSTSTANIDYSSHVFSANHVNDGCTFTIPSSSSDKEVYHYDLCPLLSSDRPKIQVVADENTPPTHTRHVYDIARLGTDGLEWDGTLPSSLQCGKGTWICLTVINTRPDHPSEPSRILQVIPISTIQNINPKAKYISNTQVQVAFHGGRYTGKKHKAVFQLNCDNNIKASSPQLLWSFNGTHTFSWASKHACPTILPISAIPPMPTAKPRPDDEPPDSPPQETEDPEPPRANPYNDDLTTIFVGIFLAVLLVVYLRRRIPRRILRYSTMYHGHQQCSFGRELPEDQMNTASISLEELSENGGHERHLLSPRDTTFPTYGL